MPDEIQNQAEVKSENCVRQKKIYLIIGIVILLIACAAVAAVCFWPKKFSQKKLLGYYQELGNKCHNNGCCLTSVKTMSDGNFKLEPEAGCPAGYKSNMLLCAQSYKWCEPVKNAEATSTEANINIADWQTYRNEKYSYEIKYPNKDYTINFFAQEKDDHNADNVLFYNNSILSSPEPLAGIAINVYPNLDKLSLENYLKKNYEKWLGKPSKYSDFNTNIAIKFNGMEARKFSTDRDHCIIFTKDNYLFAISYFDENEINKILSSFKFIE